MGSNLEISASEAEIQHIFKNSNLFTVPDYQRLYSWDEEQWSEFWKDLTSITQDDTHFLGSIVVIQHKGSFDQLDTLELVDGQQRLTTISLLLRVMQEYYEDRGDPNGIGEKIDEDYIHETDFDNNEYPKLELSRFDNEEYQEILDGNPQSVSEENQLRKAYEFFSDKVRNESKEEIDRLRKHLLRSLTIVVVECDSTGSAFRLFETLNNRGLELSAVDLMKNALLQVASEKHGDDSDEYQHIRDQWERVLETVVHRISQPDRFFRQYIMSRSEPDVEGSVTPRELYDTFREIIETELPTENVTLSDYVDGMVEKAELYIGLVNGGVDVYPQPQQKKINKRIQNLNDIEASHARTLLLRAFEEFSDYEDVLSLLRMLEVFMVRWRVAGYQTGSNLDKIFSDLCSDAFDDSDPLKTIRLRLEEEAPSDDEFRSQFANADFSRNSQTKYILDQIEGHHYMNSGNGKKYNRATVDIEHIAPQRTYTAKKYSPWRDIVGVAEAEFNQYRNRLGNLTLLEERLNQTASDNPFDQKKEVYTDSDFEMTQAVCDEYDEWSIEQIEDRSERMADIGVDIWTFNRFK